MTVTELTEDASVFTSNVFVVPGDRTTLVDAGAMPGVVDAIGAHVSSLDAVVVTHQHADHVDRLDDVVAAFDPAVLAAADHPHRTRSLADGDVVRIGGEDFDVVATPGHADDHLAFVSETTLFSGDLVVYEDEAYSGGSFGRTDLAGQSRETLVESIETLSDRVPDTVEAIHPGHGPSHAGDVHDVLVRALERASRGEPKYPGE
ncbi:MAG: MBL fold metallo-hydrolase [Halanaeroarchaeum sp.]